MKKTFIVAATASNQNSFGLKGVILVAQDGEAWSVGSSTLYLPKQGDKVTIDTNNFAGRGWEIPHRMKPDAPAEVVKQLWKGKVKELTA